MARRRLLALAGTIGLLVGLCTSTVGAQAETAGPDWTYNALLATYTAVADGGGNVCLGGTQISSGSFTTCTITQGPTGRNNVAVCVQNNNNTDVQACHIVQANTTRNNYALIIQRWSQSQSPVESAEQDASITQTNGTGSNFGGIFQVIRQTTSASDSGNNQNQADIQEIALANGPGPGFSQSSATGNNYAFASQFSLQNEQNGLGQSQYSAQFAGNSGTTPSNGIDQSTAGANAAALHQIQKQEADSPGSAAQAQRAFQDGDIGQNGAPGMNLAAGTQRHDQIENAPGLASQQIEIGSAHCCSTQSGGHFFIKQDTNQLAAGASLDNSVQQESIVGNCDSPPVGSSTAGGCQVQQSATENGNTTTSSCSGASCHSGILCTAGTCAPCDNVGGGCAGPLALSRARSPLAIRFSGAGSERNTAPLSNAAIA